MILIRYMRMKPVLLSIALICISIAGFSQPGNLRKLFFQPGVQINGTPLQYTISKKDVFKNGLIVTPPDESYKVVKFTAFTDCPSGLNDFGLKEYTGNRIEPNDPFLNHLTVKFGFEITNVVVERQGVRYLLTDRRFTVTE